jgi:hypothetical protein
MSKINRDRTLKIRSSRKKANSVIFAGNPKCRAAQQAEPTDHEHLRKNLIKNTFMLNEVIYANSRAYSAITAFIARGAAECK